MKTIYRFLIPLICIICLLSCAKTEKSFFSDKNYAERVKADFDKRKSMISEKRAKALFSVFDNGITLEEKEALEFLYAYMPLCDLADYDGDFYLSQIRSAFQAKEYFDWGKTIPEDIFRHFVLVYRVNNETLDSSRVVFFNELKDRVKGLTMEQAALEVNHWCHEKVTYRSTDSRTSASLALAKTSWGRCGEESVFAAAALRSVGIPTRQCYTPRWAHTDDNHAWVEVWVDGKWYYMGACEPEPKLNVAWFTGPAKRAMMVHTNVFGYYTGPEEKNVEKPWYSTINSLSNYADTRNVNVIVTDVDGKAVEGAKVAFKVYNYAQYYPLATTLSGADGKTSLISGYGDVLVWASKDGVFGYITSTPKDETVTVVLNKKKGDVFEDTFELVPPAEQKIEEIPAELIAENTKRLLYEDSIRNAYMNTFINEEEAGKFADKLGLSKTDTWKYLNASQGNWRDISTFIEKYKDNENLFPYLASVTEKDLRDTPEQILTSHFANAFNFGIKEGTPSDVFVKNVASPRISTEIIRPWRTYFHTQFNDEVAEYVQGNAAAIVDFVKESVKIDEEQNYYNNPLTPQGVYELGIANKRSRDIYFVALCRSAGIAARLEPATGRPQYYDGEWKNAEFEKDIKNVLPQGKVTFTDSKENVLKPRYYTHYTLGRFEDGDFVTLNLGRSQGKPFSVDEGYYRLVIGSRANDGSVTTVNKYFTIKEGESLTFDIKMPEVGEKVQVLGIIDMNTKITLNNGTETTLKHLSNEKGVVLCFADPDKEPTKHILQDLPAQTAELNTWGGGVLFLVPNDRLSPAFDNTVFKGLPTNTAWGVDNDRSLLNTATSTLQLDFSNNFPLTLFLNNNGGILYWNQGYKIGIGENIVKTIKVSEK